MPQLPRALIVDDDPEFVKGVASCILGCGREIAVRVESSIDGALIALDQYRPHIMFLSWGMQAEGRQTCEILGRMCSLMDSDPGGYDYPFLLNTKCAQAPERLQNQHYQLFRAENIWHQEDDHVQWRVWCPGVIAHWAKQPRTREQRTLRLTSGTVDLANCIHLRISDSPTRLWAYFAGRAAPVEIRRDRRETFDVISEQIVIPHCDGELLHKLPAFFVKANMRNGWVNLAHVKCIEYDEEGEFIFVFSEPGSKSVPLTKNVAHVVSHRLEMLKRWNFWPHLAHIRVPE